MRAEMNPQVSVEELMAMSKENRLAELGRVAVTATSYMQVSPDGSVSPPIERMQTPHDPSKPHATSFDQVLEGVVSRVESVATLPRNWQDAAKEDRVLRLTDTVHGTILILEKWIKSLQRVSS